MEISERQDDFRAVESRPMFGESALPRKVEEKLPAVHVLHHETQMMRRRERIPKEEKYWHL